MANVWDYYAVTLTNKLALLSEAKAFFILALRDSDCLSVFVLQSSYKWERADLNLEFLFSNIYFKFNR